MKRIILMVLRNFWRVPFAWFRLLYHAAHVDKYTEEEHYKLLKYIDHMANTGGNLVVDIHGKENLPEKSGYVLYPNHQGMYDVLALVEASPVPIAVVAKKEVENIQFLKQVFACTKSFMMDRENVRQSLKVIASVTEEVKKGRNYVIFPEGTRSKNGNTVGEFKGGSFKAAMNAKAPLVPVALIDCFKPFDSNTIKKVKVQVHFLKPMYHEEYKGMKSTEIAAKVQKEIQETIREHE